MDHAAAVFLLYNFQLSFPCGRLSRLVSAFERTLEYHLVSYRIVSYPTFEPATHLRSNLLPIAQCQCRLKPEMNGKRK